MKQKKAKATKPPEVLWWARYGGIVRLGPYRTQIEAYEALQGLDGEPAPGSSVWAERKKG